MDSTNWKSEVRLCKVNGRNAIWHRWVEIRQCIGPGLTIANEHPGGFICDTFALVEFEGGEVEKVPVNQVKFLGTKNAFERRRDIYNET